MSDLDLAVFADPPLADSEREVLLTELMEEVRRKAIDLVDLRRAPPVLAYEVVDSGKLLFCRDTDALNRFERRALLHYFDTQHLRSVQERYMREYFRGA